MTKVIEVNKRNGVWQVPLKEVAEHRAEYYSTVDGFERGSKRWNEEVDFILEDDFEGIDWMVNNSNWSDWEEVAVKVSDYVWTLEEFGCSSEDLRIIEVED